MRPRHALAAAVLLALAAAGVHRLRAQDTDLADGNPSLAGSWTGKFSAKTAGLAGSVQDAKLKRPCTLSIQQTDQFLLATLTLLQDGADTVYSLHGEVGNGSFWLQGFTSGLGTPIQIVGSASGSPGALKLKGTVLLSTPESVGQGSLQLKPTPE